jgi:hypothetical protein
LWRKKKDSPAKSQLWQEAVADCPKVPVGRTGDPSLHPPPRGRAGHLASWMRCWKSQPGWCTPTIKEVDGSRPAGHFPYCNSRDCRVNVVLALLGKSESDDILMLTMAMITRILHWRRPHLGAMTVPSIVGRLRNVYPATCARHADMIAGDA